MSSRVKLTVSTLIAATLSGVYWLAFFFFAESFTAADYGPGAVPSDTWLRSKVALVMVGGPALFALCITLWRRVERRFLSGGA